MGQSVRNRNFDVILKHFACMWLLTCLGLGIGLFLPSSIVLPLSIVCLILLIIVVFIRSFYLANFILYSIPFLMGILLFWVVSFFIDVLGKEFVFSVFIGTIVIYLMLAFIGLKMSRDIANWGQYLMAVLLIVLVFSIIYFFIPISNTFALIIAIICVALFSLYTVYDFNQIRHNHVRDEEVVRMALSIYLNFVNLFSNLLEVIWRIRD